MTSFDLDLSKYSLGWSDEGGVKARKGKKQNGGRMCCYGI
jgi:hypothetical protein